jgi:6-pyruvoyltetrahydropterin/6-carboxytetrahydropterin synthase
MRYQVIKTYGANEGWSCTFRQHLADSHCHFLHGYALGFAITFECSDLDARNWCYDFGDLKSIKAWLQDTFDHKTLVAEDDPMLALFQDMAGNGLIDMRIVPAVGCEKFAELVWHHVSAHLRHSDYHPRVRLVSVKVAEHMGNAAVCLG